MSLGHGTERRAVEECVVSKGGKGNRCKLSFAKLLTPLMALDIIGGRLRSDSFCRD